MRKAAKRVYISMLMLFLSVIAVGFTTYAWVGIVSSSTFDNFTINLKPNETDDSEYGIQLSLTGKPGSFSDSIDPTSLRRQLLINCGIDASQYSDEAVNIQFNRLNLDQCTVTRRESAPNAFNQFYTVDNGYAKVTNKYFYFDLYIALYRKDGEIEPSDNYLDIYLRQVENENGRMEIMDSDSYSTVVLNKIKYPSSNPTNKNILEVGSNGLPLGYTVTGNVKVKTSTSCRLAIQKISPSAIGDVTYKYDDIKKLTVYRTGSETPMYDSAKDTYDFGAVLEKEYNFAYMYHKSLYNSTFDYLEGYANFNDVLNRGDILYEDDGEVNHIVDASDKCTTEKMARFRFYFWFEGWDSNCFDVINARNVSINLAFSTKSPKD